MVLGSTLCHAQPIIARILFLNSVEHTDCRNAVDAFYMFRRFIQFYMRSTCSGDINNMIPKTELLLVLNLTITESKQAFLCLLSF